MIKICQTYLFILVILLVSAFSSHVHAQDGEPISSVKVHGNNRVDESTILYYLKTREGEPLSRSKISQDIEQITE